MKRKKYWHNIGLDIKSEKNFESAVIDWANNKVGKYYPESIMFFEYDCIYTSEEQKFTTPIRKVCKFVSNKTSIDYIRVTYDMCVLLTVVHEDNTIYHIPSNWNGADFWYLC